MQEQIAGQVCTAIKLIIADDSPLFRLGIRSFLEELPEYAIVGEADNAEEVLRLCEQSCPDILLIDLHLPSANGTALLDMLRERYPEIKLLVFVIPHDEEGLTTCAMSSVNGCIAKNADPDLILKAVHSVSIGECWLQEDMIKTVFNGLRRARLAVHQRPQARLSTREIEVITFLAQGMRNLEIAEQLFISERTVKVHMANIFDKLGVRDRVEAVRYALNNGMVPH
ncbi:MAG TPA: response regulator transcription factor [Armatimonadota bacterium]|jgi:DNA-binding NarL/FixJ family response regulator